MKLQACFLTLFVTVFASVSAWSACSSNQLLKSAGFTVYSSGFEAHFDKAVEYYNSNQERFVDDMDDVIYSSVAGTMVRVVSYDAIATPQDVMWGDLVVMRDWRTGEKVEVRWFDKNGKHVAYNRAYQGCATNMIPMAYNSLY